MAMAITKQITTGDYDGKNFVWDFEIGDFVCSFAHGHKHIRFGFTFVLVALQ